MSRRLLIPFVPFAIYLEYDLLGPQYGVCFSRSTGLQIYAGDWTLIAA